MTVREANGNSPDDSAEPAAERDLSSLARLLHYAMCEADTLGQADAVTLINAAILSLNAEDLLDPLRAADVVDRSPASEDELGTVAPDGLVRLYNRKFC
jgi:hypothetical protein